MRSKNCRIIFIFTPFFFLSHPFYGQNPLESFQDYLKGFIVDIRRQRAVPIEFQKIVRVGVVSDPGSQTIQVLDSARLLVESDGRFQAKTLAELGVSEQDRRWMASTLVKYGVVQQEDYLIEVHWSLANQSFQNLAAVHPKNRDKALPPDFEPLLYFTRVSSRVDPATTGGRKEDSTALHLPEASGLFASMVAPIRASTPKAEDSWLSKQAWKLTLRNGYQDCATVIWGVQFRTDGCKILDPGNHGYSESPEIASALSCLFWTIKGTTLDSQYPLDQACAKGKKECLKYYLVYQQGLTIAGHFFRLADSAKTQPRDVCCQPQ
jgi:hypothetical protein